MQPSLPCPNDKKENIDSIHRGTWSVEAAELLANEAFCPLIPADLKPVEENTLPSWLWQHVGVGENKTSEYNIDQVFQRAVGAATYKGWKAELFADEAAAKSFYDSALDLFLNRFFAMEPSALANIGLDWAYGLNSIPMSSLSTESAVELSINNKSIDAILGGNDDNVRSHWRRFLGKTAGQKLSIRFEDTTNEWETSPRSSGQTPRLMLNLTRFGREETTLDIPALREAVRIAVLLLELHYGQLVAFQDSSRGLAIGFCGLHDLLMRRGLAYDSQAGRATAAAICSIITAVATKTSAQLAQTLGPCAAFGTERTNALRVVENRRRAAYGDANDYEHVSVLPLPLSLNDCPDLALVAEARHDWDEAVVAAKRYGLRHMQLTGFFSTPTFPVMTGCAAAGIGPEVALTTQRRLEADVYTSEVHPALSVGLTRLGYSAEDIRKTITYVVGNCSLETSKSINKETLKAHGFNDAALQRVEDYLPRVRDIRLAMTPWIVGEKFCRETLKIPAKKLEDFSFDLLTHLGFSEAEAIAANHSLYGYGTVEECPELRHEHSAVFACGEEISSTAKIKMAAAVQCFVTGEVGLTLALSASSTTQTRSELLLEAWQQGVKNISIYFEQTGIEKKRPAPATPSIMRPHRRMAIGKPAPQSFTSKMHAIGTPTVKLSRKASTKIVSLTRKSASITNKTKH